jgi:uncharacterized protein YhaN
MQLQELTIEAFGPFTDKQLLFSSDTGAQGGFHLIYGKNEAGKSACLRALKALLYGIPTRTSDNFLHANKKLRISARLQHSNGDSLFIRRRKGRLNTLSDRNNNALDDAVLAPYLQGLNQTSFEILFGLDHSSLVQGGEEILAQQGEVGLTLFSAGMGVANLRHLVEELEQKAKLLYTPRGMKPEVNALKADYKHSLKKIRTQSLSAPQWKKQRKELDSKQQDLQTQSDQLTTLKQQRRQLERLQTVQRLLIERDTLQQQLTELGVIPNLSTNFTAQRIKALSTWEDSQHQLDGISTELVQLAAKQGYIQLDKALLNHATALETLQHKITPYLNDKQEVEKNHQQQQRLAVDNQQLLLFLSPELVQTAVSSEIGSVDSSDDALVQRLSPFLHKRQRIRALAQQQSSLQQAVIHAKKQQQERQRQLKKAEQALSELPPLHDTKALAYSIKITRDQGDLEKKRSQLIIDYENQSADCKRDIQRLGLCRDDLHELEVLPIPSMETVERFKQQFQQNNSLLEQYQQKKQQIQQQLQQLEGELKALTLSGEVPSEQGLQQARKKRQQLWIQIRTLALTPNSSDDVHYKTALLDQFEQQLNANDQLADRLRRENKRVHKQADLLAQQEVNKKQLEECLAVITIEAKQQKQLELQWKTLWQQTTLAPLPPKEMRVWLQRLHQLQQQVSELNKRLEAVEQFNETYQEACRLIEEGLHYTGGLIEGLKSHEYENIHWLLTQAEQRLEHLQETARDKDNLKKEITHQTDALVSTQQELQQAEVIWQDWQQQWQRLLTPLGLNDDVLSIEINELLDKTSAWFSNRDTLLKLLKKFEQLQQTQQTFETDCEALQASLMDNEAVDLLPDQWVKQQFSRLKQQQKQQQSLQKLQHQQQEKTISQHHWQQRFDSSQIMLENLCTEANCQQIEALEHCEQTVAEAHKLKSQLKQLQQRLKEQGGNDSLESLERQLADKEHQGKHLPEEIEALTQQIEAQQAQRDQINQDTGRLEEQLHQCESQTGAVEYLDEKHTILAAISDKVQTYLRHRLAQRMLQQHIESYRQQHQGPILKRAGEYFATLSCNSFQGLGVDYDANDQAIIVGQRNADEAIGIEGMSDGTRDQLYLALRLASLEQHTRSAEPLPFILDDILINFDNQRALAGLTALSQLAQTTQVILFTHHRHMIDLFAEHQQQGKDFLLHEL